jgi:hypothetical protein
MSGGSYNYLCFQTETRSSISLTDLADMRDRLNQLAPGSAAARDTAALYEQLSHAQDNELGALAEVWHDVEWFDSGDYGEDQARAGIAKYETTQHADEPTGAAPGDLAARVLAAIDETERTAQAAVGSLTGSWSVEPFEPSRPEAVPASAWVDDGDEGIATVNGSFRAEHIAHNDPAAVLRRCAADRKIVHRYQKLASLPNKSYAQSSALDAYRSVLYSLAEGYGITTEETT